MRVVGINGSGRADGNTAVLVRGVLDGAAEAGAETSFLQLAQMSFVGCDSWQGCKKAHRCQLQDDMQRFYDLAPGADLLVFGAPIYFDHLAWKAKAFFDRLYCYLGPELENYYPNPKARIVIALTYGAGGEHTYDDVADWLQERFRFYFGLETAARFAIPFCGFQPLIEPTHPTVQEARAFGRSLG